MGNSIAFSCRLSKTTLEPLNELADTESLEDLIEELEPLVLHAYPIVSMRYTVSMRSGVLRIFVLGVNGLESFVH